MITGRTGFGISTVCRRIVEKLNCEYGGMMSAYIIYGLRENVRKNSPIITAFELMDISNRERGILTSKNGHEPKLDENGTMICYIYHPFILFGSVTDFADTSMK